MLPLDGKAAPAYSDLLTLRRQARKATTTVDLMIAATALASGAIVGDKGGFKECGQTVVDAWTAARRGRA